jgi:hypothetical protein
VHGLNLDVLVPCATADVLVLDPHVGKMDVSIEVRQVVLACPFLDLLGVSLRPTVTLGSISIGLLKEALILALQLVVQDGALDAGIRCVQPLSGLEIGVIDLGVVLDLARLPDARVEGLARLAVDIAATRFKQISTAISEDNDRLAMAFEVNGSYEPRLAQVAEVSLTRVGGTTVVIPKVVSRDDPKRADRRKRAALRTPKAVSALADVHTLALVPAREIETLGENVARLNGTELAGIAAGATAPTHVRSIAGAFPRIVAPPRIVEIAHVTPSRMSRDGSLTALLCPVTLIS